MRYVTLSGKQVFLKVKELDLDGCTATEIEGLTDEYSSLEKLSIAGVGLTTLAGFPALPSLVKVRYFYHFYGFSLICRVTPLLLALMLSRSALV